LRTAVLAYLLLAAAARADLIHIHADTAQSTAHLGNFSGTLEYNPVTRALLVSITNDTAPATGGFLTGFLLNIAGHDPHASAALVAAPAGFSDIGGQSAPPFGGPFDAGAALGGRWTGGGSPAPGIAPGQTALFRFTVAASDAATLAAADFIAGPAPVNFAARFRGMIHGGSDKIPGMVPGPAAFAAMIPLLAVWARRRSRDIR
jgi:hypothetical protein